MVALEDVMSNGQSPPDPDHTKTIEALKRATELAEAEKKKFEAAKARLEAEKALNEQQALGAEGALKAKTASETAAQKLAEAEKNRITAERELERARKPPDAAVESLQAKAATAKAEKELAEAKKAAAELAKAEAEASKAKSDADLAAFKARFDVPTSQYKGEVALKENAGKTEALLLAAQAVRSAAAAIAEAIQHKAGEVMLIPSPDVPTFDNEMRFRVEIGIVRKAFDDTDRAAGDARNAQQKVIDAARQQAPPTSVSHQESAVPPVAAAGLTLEAADKLLGFFKTDYTVGGVDVTLEDATLLNELAGRLVRTGWTVHLPKVFNALDSSQASADEVINELERLASRKADATFAAAEHERQTMEWTNRAANESDEQKKKDMTAAAEAHKKAADAIRRAIGLYDSWFQRLSSPDEKSAVVPIVAIIKERAMMKVLNNGRSLLVVKLHASGGSYYTRKNIWTVFGGMPFFHMGGTVASFALIAGNSGTIAAAGTVPVHGGFFKASRLANQIVGEPGPPRKRSWRDRFFGGR